METVTVNAAALRRVLTALSGPGHLIRELQATRGLSSTFGPEYANPIDTLVDEFNAAIAPIEAQAPRDPS